MKISRDTATSKPGPTCGSPFPTGRSLELHLAVGRVAASNVNGRLRVEAVAAPVSVTGGKGDLSVRTASGDIRVSGGSGPARLSTGLR